MPQSSSNVVLNFILIYNSCKGIKLSHDNRELFFFSISCLIVSSQLLYFDQICVSMRQMMFEEQNIYRKHRAKGIQET